MTHPIVWPLCVLTPASTPAKPMPFSRGGGRTLGGLSRSVRTDRGYWTIDLHGVVLRTTAQRRTWQAIRAGLAGMPGLCVVPVWGDRSAPYASGRFERSPTVPHSDGSTFSDGSRYRGRSIAVRTAAPAAIGDTTIQLEIVHAIDDLAGVRFSYDHAFYETGRALEVDGNIWTIELATTIRAPIPHGADLEFDRPTCLCHLASDTGMNIPETRGFEVVSVSFVEATDYWADLAAGLLDD